MQERIGGVDIPDTELIRAATEEVRARTNDLLFHHSRRVFLFGALTGRRRGLRPDPELLYVGAMFHDLGLMDEFSNSTNRFEVDSANAAAAFLRSHGASRDEIANIWAAIALHTTPGIPEFMSPEIALVTAGVETDVLGIGYSTLDPAVRAEVTAAHPRPDFKKAILDALTKGNVRRPHTTFGNVNSDVLSHFMPNFKRTDFVDVIDASDWPE